ncbi:MAG: histidine--tRNA ligase [Minisyncoccales bacterium]
MSKKGKFQTPKGIHDILPKKQKYYRKVYQVCKKIADYYGFEEIYTPILEKRKIYEKGTGAGTDIVQKEMFELETKGGEKLALRPEGTPGIVRSYIENGMSNWQTPVKLWYFGPFFRYEKPQAGRYRQFWQFGFEVIGQEDAAVDAELIQIFYNILKELKLEEISIKVNSIGDESCRPEYLNSLKTYFKENKKKLCKDCKKRLKNNVLRILDCKNKKCNEVKEDAPQIIDNLCDDCHDHFKTMLEFLDETNIPYELDSSLVRGLDYYTRTVFEAFSENEDEEKGQNALGGGGRYDKLVELFGGKETPASGMAGGVERIIEKLVDEKLEFESTEKPKVFLAQIGKTAKRETFRLLEEFREEGIKIAESLGRNSLRPQLNIADKMEVDYTLILGKKEVEEDEIIIRNMEDGKQKKVKLSKIVDEIKKRLK